MTQYCPRFDLGLMISDSVIQTLTFICFHWLQAVKQILEDKAIQRSNPCINGATFTFQRSNMHDELHASLAGAARLMCELQTDPATDNNGADICSAQVPTSPSSAC